MSATHCYRIPPQWVVLYAAFVATLLAWEDQTLHWIGAGFSIPLVGLALYDPWWGWLELFPLAFGMRPAPATVGVQEGIFGLIVVTTVVRTLANQGRRSGGRGLARSYTTSLVVGGVVAGVNFVVARSNGVALMDWLRGLTPFVFLLLAIPLAHELRKAPARVPQLVGSLTVAFLLFAGHVVAFFFFKKLYQPYWLVGADDSRIHQKIQ